MVAVSFYFQVHQPYRLRPEFDYFAVGSGEDYEDDAKNAAILRKVASKCYLPANALMLELIKKHQGRFKISYAISGVALEQFLQYEPTVIESFRALAETGCVEFIGETYYHSLASLFSEREFRRQVKLHQKALRDHLGVTARTFRNTELIYNNHIAHMVESMGYKAILAEGADRILGWRSPNFVYSPVGTRKIKLLLKNYQLSDDIAFRFSDRGWNQWPLTAEKYCDWLQAAAVTGDTINLYMDYETFGEHQWEASGIFEFLKRLPDVAIERGFAFRTPGEVARRHQAQATLDVPAPVSWADSERDVSAWLGNHLQDAAAEAIYALEKDALQSHDEALIHAWAKLQTSDHFYYMCTKWFQDGDVHKYFSPYASPYDSFIYYTNALNELRLRLAEATRARREARRASIRERRRKMRPAPGLSPAPTATPRPRPAAARSAAIL